MVECTNARAHAKDSKSLLWWLVSIKDISYFLEIIKSESECGIVAWLPRNLVQIPTIEPRVNPHGLFSPVAVSGQLYSRVHKKRNNLRIHYEGEGDFGAFLGQKQANLQGIV